MIVVVTGATGTVGRPLVNELRAAGVVVRAVTRHPETAEFDLEVAVLDSVADALPGASAMFLNSRALGDGLADVVAQARRHGVRRLVALAALNVDDDDTRQPSRFIGDRNREVERAAVDSGLEWVSLRPTQFISALADMWAPQIRGGDTVSGPFGQASNAPIDATDIAAVAAQAFLTDDLVGRRIALTGPGALTNVELAEVVGEVLDRPLRYEEVSAERVHQNFRDRGFPAEFAQAYLDMQARTLHTPPLVTDEVHAILGRPAVSWRDWVDRHRALFTAEPERQTA